MSANDASKPPLLSILVSTYNQPRWLELVLWGYSVQTVGDFELIVVDDGSGPETREVIERMRGLVPYRLRHFWQPDEGFQKCRAMNRAILLARADYLVLTDGDCIPRADFLAWHLRLRAPGRFLTGGYSKLPLELSRRIEPADVLSGRATDYGWLAANGLQRHTLKLRLQRDWTRALLNVVTPVKPLLHGHNASLWRQDALGVNGYDERMQYGEEDLEFGDRLTHAGIRGKTIRYSAVCVHLEHARGYVSDEMRRRNHAIRAETSRTRRRRTEYGIDTHRDEPLQADEGAAPQSGDAHDRMHAA
jgi:glycosyltransferase involved in cell wall biosynthesis